jgi:hypothetical protein
MLGKESVRATRTVHTHRYLFTYIYIYINIFNYKYKCIKERELILNWLLKQFTFFTCRFHNVPTCFKLVTPPRLEAPSQLRGKPSGHGAWAFHRSFMELSHPGLVEAQPTHPPQRSNSVSATSWLNCGIGAPTTERLICNDHQRLSRTQVCDCGFGNYCI